MTRTFRAPGRVNLIGEHTDYNDGFVCPVAIDLATTVAAVPRDDRTIRVQSEHFPGIVEFSLDETAAKARGAWPDYVQGVALALEQNGYRLYGAELRIGSDLPIGAGLSSSAALEVSAAMALSRLAGHDVPNLELATICLQAESEFIGLRCGIMDQFVSVFGVADHAVLLDCRSCDWRAIPLPAPVRMVTCNTMVNHALTGSEYNNRRMDCETAAQQLGVASLRDASLEELARVKLPQFVGMRAQHVIQEIRRTQQAAEALDRGDLTLFGRYMYDSHESLRHDYQVSCAELDIMVEIARTQPGVHGARMTGGGFGGCTINLVESEHAAAFRRHMAAAYYEVTGIQPDIYICRAVNGAHEVTS